MTVDFLIIGQGLAGSILAWELTKRGRKIIVVDNGEQNASSVSAGLINPITGLRFVKTHDIDILLPAARSCYKGLEGIFHQRFWVELPMRRILQTQAEFEHCRKRVEQADYSAYLGELHTQNRQWLSFKTPHGYIDQRQTARVLTTELLSCLRQWLQASNSYRPDVFDYNALNFNRHMHWQDNINAEQVIFCEGHAGSRNPWFAYLPLKPAKGEILTLDYPSGCSDTIINFGHWLVPLAENKARIGATFEWQFSDNKPSESGKHLLLKSLKAIEINPQQHRVTRHDAGIRPCTEDKQPFLGTHPNHSQIHIFNGFGTKGCLQIPWYAQRFADYLTKHQTLPANCDIQRYQSRFVPA